jgi:hypothetical protein
VQALQERGHMQAGMIADIAIFDPKNVTEHATFKAGTAGLASTGIPYDLVNGVIVVRDSRRSAKVRFLPVAILLSDRQLLGESRHSSKQFICSVRPSLNDRIWTPPHLRVTPLQLRANPSASNRKACTYLNIHL